MDRGIRTDRRRNTPVLQTAPQRYTIDSIYLAGIAGGSDDVVKELDTHMQEYGIRAKAPGMIKGISFVKTAVSDHGEINAEPASYIYGIGNLLL